jgi:hypothetical protein
MRNTGFRFLLVSFAFFTACSRDGQRPVESGSESPATSGTSPESPDQVGAWTYKSAEYGFSLDLQSAQWKPAPKRQWIEVFACRTGVGSWMLAGVDSVKKQTREQFEASVAKFKMDVVKQGDFLKDPAFREGQSAWGCPYVFAEWCEKGPSNTQFVYVAASVVWLGDKGIAVSTVFEGQGLMRSKVFQAIESADFEKAARTICISPR